MFIVNKKLFAEYTDKHKDGVAKIAIATDGKVSSSYIRKVMAGHVPGRATTREAIAKAMGVPHNELFLDQSYSAEINNTEG